MRARQDHASLSPRAHSPTGICCLTLQQLPPACPEANPQQQTLPWLLSTPSSYLQFQTSVFTPRPITELFSLEGLHHCLSPAAYHVSISLYIYIYNFFFPKKVWILLFSAPSPCAGGNSCFGTRGKDCRNISCWSWERLPEQKHITVLQRAHSPCTAQHTRQMQHSEFAFDTAQTKSPMETQKAEQGHHILYGKILSLLPRSSCYTRGI